MKYSAIGTAVIVPPDAVLIGQSDTIGNGTLDIYRYNGEYFAVDSGILRQANLSADAMISYLMLRVHALEHSLYKSNPRMP